MIGSFFNKENIMSNKNVFGTGNNYYKILYVSIHFTEAKFVACDRLILIDNAKITKSEFKQNIKL